MTRIAHLTDLHLLEQDHARRRGAERWRLAWLSFGRATDAGRRRCRAVTALHGARQAGADHLLLTGDLTEDGVSSQFDVLASVLAESGWDPACVTLVPGNHDMYADGSAWERALAGPLRPFSPTSTPGAVKRLPGVVVLAVSTAFQQPFTRSAGRIPTQQLERIVEVAHETRRRGDALVIAQHHPPLRHSIAAMQWIDGLANHREAFALLREHDHIHVVHGHTHRAGDVAVRPGAMSRIFSADALVDDPASLRLYHAYKGRLVAEPKAEVEAMAVLALA